MRDVYAIMAIMFAAVVVAGIVQEFWRGVRARHRLHGEQYLLALARLVGRNRRRYGGYIVHLGIVMYFVAFTGQAFKTEMEASLKPGESVDLRSPFGYTYTFTHIGVSQYEALNRFVSAATVDITRDGDPVGVLTSEKRQHVDSFKRPTFEPSTEAAIKYTLREDLYVVYAGSVEGTEEAVYRFTINPMVVWVWFGGATLVFGGVITLWPGGGPTRRAPRRELAGYQATFDPEPASAPTPAEPVAS
jgi:cytochrome c-type biogenesis protein CcmF